MEDTTRDLLEQLGQRTVPEKFAGTAIVLLQEAQATFTFS